jgi:hypothetical protein
MRTLWSAAVYWPAWLAASVAAFLLREVWALTSGRPGDTLSAWVWRLLKITSREPVGNWSAADFLVFGVWMVLVTWLTLHFFMRRFT